MESDKKKKSTVSHGIKWSITAQKFLKSAEKLFKYIQKKNTPENG